MSARRPMWTEGLFIMPQHFQLMDEFHEHLLDERLGALGPHHWGVADLEVDADELARGVFQLSRCTAILPDGTLVKVDRNQAIRGLAVTVGEVRGNVDVYLGVPSAGTSSASSEQGGGSRFINESHNTADLYRTAPDTEVACVRPNAQLLLGQENRHNYVTLKLAELTLGESGRLVLSDTYVPPCLRLRVSQPVMQRLGRLVSALAAKQKDMVARYGGRSAAMVEFGAADLSTFWYLHTVNSALPVFMHYAAGDVHPEQLYLGLSVLAGQLATFEQTSDPLDLGRFDYLNLDSTLHPLFERIFALLGRVVSARYTTIALEQSQPGLFVGRVDDPQLLRRNDLYLVAGGDIPETSLRDDVPRYVKVGSMDQIAQIVQSALPGVAANVDLAPPSAIPVRAHMVYLRLDKQGPYWDGIAQSSTIAIYQPVKPERVQLELLAVEP